MSDKLFAIRDIRIYSYISIIINYNINFMKITKRLLSSLILLLIFCSLFFISNIEKTQAKNLWELQEESGFTQIGKAFDEGENDEPTDIRRTTVLIIKIFLTFIGIIALIYIILAGYKWLTAGGNQDQVGEAKKQILNGAIGLIVILASYAMLDFFARCIMKALDGSGVWMCDPL